MSVEVDLLLQEAKESIEAAQNYRSELQQRLHGLNQARKQVTFLCVYTCINPSHQSSCDAAKPEESQEAIFPLHHVPAISSFPPAVEIYPSSCSPINNAAISCFCRATVSLKGRDVTEEKGETRNISGSKLTRLTRMC